MMHPWWIYPPWHQSCLMPTPLGWYTPNGSAWCMNAALKSGLARAALRDHDHQVYDILKHVAAVKGLAVCCSCSPVGRAGGQNKTHLLFPDPDTFGYTTSTACWRHKYVLPQPVKGPNVSAPTAKVGVEPGQVYIPIYMRAVGVKGRKLDSACCRRVAL